ncbi:hypothetical protein CBL_03571 [Carabus blaptoides fortunei]
MDSVHVSAECWLLYGATLAFPAALPIHCRRGAYSMLFIHRECTNGVTSCATLSNQAHSSSRGVSSMQYKSVEQAYSLLATVLLQVAEDAQLCKVRCVTWHVARTLIHWSVALKDQ